MTTNYYYDDYTPRLTVHDHAACVNSLKTRKVFKKAYL